MNGVLDIGQIKRLNNRYKFKLNVISDYVVVVDSGTDEWTIESEPKKHIKHKNIILKHKNKHSRTNNYHIHRRFYDYNWVFGAINNHEQGWFRKYNRLNRLLQKINTVNA